MTFTSLTVKLNSAAMNCGCRSSETCKCAPHLDIGELRDKVRELKAHKATLLDVADSITQEIDSKMAKLREAKHHRLQVDPDPELRLHFSNSHDSPSSELNDEQFRVANEKLEMQILMQDMRAALVTLEKEVRWREAVATKSKKTSAKLSKITGNGPDGSPLIWHAIGEVKDRLKEEVHLSAASHKLRVEAVEAEKRETNQLLQDASSFRKQLAQLLRERDHVIGVTDSVEQQYRSERYRQQLVREEFMSQREALRRFHGGFGFQVNHSATLKMHCAYAWHATDRSILKGNKWRSICVSFSTKSCSCDAALDAPD